MNYHFCSFCRKVLGNLDTTGAQLTANKVARFWIDGRTSLPNHKPVMGNALENTVNGMFPFAAAIEYWTVLSDFK